MQIWLTIGPLQLVDQYAEFLCMSKWLVRSLKELWNQIPGELKPSLDDISCLLGLFLLLDKCQLLLLLLLLSQLLFGIPRFVFVKFMFSGRL